MNEDKYLDYTVIADIIGAMMSMGFSDIRIAKYQDDANTYSVMAQGITSANTKSKIDELCLTINGPGLAVPVALSKSFRIEIYANNKTQVIVYDFGWQALYYQLPDYVTSGVYIRFTLDLSELQSDSAKGAK